MKKVWLIILGGFVLLLPLFVNLPFSDELKGSSVDLSILGMGKLKGGEVIKSVANNLGYYGTCFSILWAVTSYRAKEKELKDSIEEQRKKEEKESLEIKGKEIERYRDSFRPSFVLDSGRAKLLLVMKNSDYYLENVRYYRSADHDGVLYVTLAHNAQIDLDGAVNNYFVTADTMIGEKIIFGIVLNNLKIYKSLKVGASPVLPSDFQVEDRMKEGIDKSWTSFNECDLGGSSEESDRVDVHFMYRTVAIREKMTLNRVGFLKGIVNQVAVKDLFEKTLSTLSVYGDKFDDVMVMAVIGELKSILQENLDRITIEPCKMNDGIWVYINKKSGIEKRSYEEKLYSAYYVVNEYVNEIGGRCIGDIISVFSSLVEEATFCEELNLSVVKYRDRILKRIEDVECFS